MNEWTVSFSLHYYTSEMPSPTCSTHLLMSSIDPQRGIATETRRQLNTLRNTLLSRSFQHWPIALALLYNHPVLFRDRVQLQETTPVTEESRGAFLSHSGYFKAPIFFLSWKGIALHDCGLSCLADSPAPYYGNNWWAAHKKNHVCQLNFSLSTAQVE
jgi:hypothetical protein